MSALPETTPKQDKGCSRPDPYFLIAACSGASSTFIAFLALVNFPHVTGSASMVWAVCLMIAAMVSAPAVMGIGVAFFLSRRPRD